MQHDELQQLFFKLAELRDECTGSDFTALDGAMTVIDGKLREIEDRD